jgi:DNA adenine methylase
MTVPQRPFVKAAGGKTKLAPEILRRVPEFAGTYHEPFLGGGAIFLAVAERRSFESKVTDEHVPFRFGRGGVWAILSDANPELMNAYEAVKAQGPALVEKLQGFKHSKEAYYAVRAKEETESLARAARFLYLNKTCYNGLWRVNAAGKFNVPVGSYKNPTIVEPAIVLGWQSILVDAELHCRDFGPAIDVASQGDFLYADPPYLPRSKSADFTSYTSDKFVLKDHERLAASLASASKRGVKFLCSQGDSAAIRALYKEFQITAVSVRHSVGARASSRVKVDEVLIQNFA